MYIRYRDREDAALKLIPLLDKYRNANGIALAVPRGGVPIAYYIAKAYDLPLDLLMTKKIGHPSNMEFAIGAVSLEDHFLDEGFDLPESYLTQEVQRIRSALKEKYRKFMGEHQPQPLENKVVIILDDGMATGNTILSSIKMLRKQKPNKIVVAVPVASVQAVQKLKSEVDEVISLQTPDPFIGVGLYYENFEQVSDEEVIRLLKEINHLKDAA
jgi:putative phosphoribosyl transferase